MAKRGPKFKKLDLPSNLPQQEVLTRQFENSHVKLAFNLCLLGATDEQIAKTFGIDVRLLYEWKNDHPELDQALKAGRLPADSDIGRSLYDRARGFKFVDNQAIKVKEVFYDDNGKKLKEIEKVEIVAVERTVPADTTACIFWLKNRQKAMWRDRYEHTGADGGAIKTSTTIDVSKIDPADREILRTVLKSATVEAERETVADRQRLQ